MAKKGSSPSNGRRKKKKVNIIPALVTVLVLSVITALMVGAAYIFGGNTADNSHKHYSPAADNTKTESDYDNGITVNILQSDCTVKVGTVMNVTASVKPDGAGAVTWTSGNPEVLVVDSTGRVVVVGTGIATITATIGTASDTIIVESISDVANDSVLKLPQYQDGSTQNTQTSAAAENQENASVSGEGEEAGIANTNNQTQRVTLEQQTANETFPSTENTTRPASQNTVVLPTQARETPLSDVKSTELSDTLVSEGFTRHIDGTYVYEKDDVCYGEIVINSDSTHIYVIQHSTDFDNAALTVIKELLPKSYNTVWSTADSTKSDATTMADGRKVRIVIPKNEGHKQIVIYN